MKDYEDNTDDEVMREHEEEFAMRLRHAAPYEHPPCKVTVMPGPSPTWRFGFLFRWGSLWIGAHYAPHNKRLCLNLIPCVTLWFTFPGGVPPR